MLKLRGSLKFQRLPRNFVCPTISRNKGRSPRVGSLVGARRKQPVGISTGPEPSVVDSSKYAWLCDYTRESCQQDCYSNHSNDITLSIFGNLRRNWLNSSGNCPEKTKGSENWNKTRIQIARLHKILPISVGICSINFLRISFGRMMSSGLKILCQKIWYGTTSWQNPFQTQAEENSADSFLTRPSGAGSGS